MKHANLISLLVIFAVFCMVIPMQAQTDPVDPQSVDTLPLLDLVDFTRKPGMIVPVYTRDNNFPWLPVGGGVVTGGLVTYLLTRDNNPSTPPLIINPDNASVPCDGSTTINILQNDSGDNLEIVNIAPVSSATVTQGPGGTITISDVMTAMPFTILVTVQDAHGQTGQNPVNVTVDRPPILVVNDNFTTAFGTPISGNVLDNDQGDLQVTSHTQPADGTVSIDADGAFTFIPADDFQGTVTFGYNVSGPCDQTAFGLVTIEVLPPDCAFSASVITTPADCAEDNGSATITVDPAGNYSYAWSNGGTTPVETLGAGSYTVTITSPDGLCTEELEVIVEELPPAFEASFVTTPASCGTDDGSATIEVSPGGTYTYQWSSGGTGQTVSLAAGTYTVTVTDENGCSKIFEVSVDELPPEFDATFETTPASCGLDDGSATVITDPAGTYTYLWSNGATEAAAEKLTGSEFSVTVTDENGCSKSFSVVVPESPADYLTSISSTAGNCLGEGADVSLTLTTPGSGPMQIDATGPDGPHSASSPSGQVSLSSFFTILPGNWSITITDQSIESRCSVVTEIIVDDNTIITATDDAYETLCDESVSGNVLDNDSGINLEVIDHTEPVDGQLNLGTNGQFTFTPPAGQTGEFTFSYTVRDACGNERTGNVTITVNPKDCLFETTFQTTPAHCGVADGTITATSTPEGNYTYQWSDGSTTANLADLPAGTYEVTVTSIDLNCEHVYSVTVDEIPNTYIADLQTTPGNCIGGGSISLTLSTPGDGPLVVVLTGPPGTLADTLPPGAHTLDDLPAGSYSLNVYDQGAGSACNETADITIEDNTQAPEAVDDNYETPFNTPVSGNVLDNDSGLHLQLTAVAGEGGGTVAYQSDGSFTFTPDDGFSGTGGFNYSATDTCGNSVAANVFINVMPGVCDFTPQFFVTNASCGLSDGQIDVDILEPGNYLFEWDNGTQGPTLQDVASGTYTVTITDLDLDCNLVFSEDVGEDPAEYISDVTVIQPQCPNTGEILFTVSSPGTGPMNMLVTHPGGSDGFAIPTGQIMLSDYVAIVEGDYMVVVTDDSAGPGCTDAFMATIVAATSVQISLVGTTPPSSPSGTDGTITISVDVPGTEPYTVLLNEMPWTVATGMVITIEGVGAGFYTVQLMDANGCLSNVINVEVPFTAAELSIGLGMATPAPAASLAERPASGRGSSFLPFISTNLSYPLGGARHTVGLRVMQSQSLPAIHFSYQTHLSLLETEKMWLEAGAGLRSELFNGDEALNWTLALRVSHRVMPRVNIRMEVGMAGWSALSGSFASLWVEMPLRLPR